MKTPDQTNLKFKPYVSNCKKRKEKVWECKNMLERNMLNMKKFSTNKKDVKSNFRSSMKDLTVKAISKNNN